MKINLFISKNEQVEFTILSEFPKMDYEYTVFHIHIDPRHTKEIEKYDFYMYAPSDEDEFFENYIALPKDSSIPE